MKRSIIGVAVGGAFLTLATGAFAQVVPGPQDDSALSWPASQWGKDDRAGSANHTKNPDNIKRALAQIKQFKSVTIGKFYHKEAPAFGPRGWNMTIPGTPTGGPFGKNALVYHDELVTTEIGQIQTQFDGPGHIGVNTSKGPMFYNNTISWDAYERGAGGRVLGMGRLGVEYVGELGYVCRVVLLDAVALRKAEGKLSASEEMLPIPKKPGDIGIVTEADMKAMLKAIGTDLMPGDCVALHTGMGNTWSNDRYKSLTTEQRANARAMFAQGEPGFGTSACRFMASKNIALTMGDTSANDAQPGNEEDGMGAAVPCHTYLQPARGIWNLENVDTKTLVDNKINTGAMIFAPLKIIGATGSPANPVVLY
jgi:kynurenine formamidase